MGKAANDIHRLKARGPTVRFRDKLLSKTAGASIPCFGSRAFTTTAVQGVNVVDAPTVKIAGPAGV